MREPSIHITKSQFEEILNTLEVDNFPVEAFFVIARKEAINHRAVLVSNHKNTKRVNNILLASKGDAALVADILYATRIKLKHRGVRNPDGDTRQNDNPSTNPHSILYSYR